MKILSNISVKPSYKGIPAIIFFPIFFVLFFSPVLFTERLLGTGDAIVYYIPNFYSDFSLWEPLLLSGFPIAADPQAMTWYPISFACSFFFRSWNLFIVTAYILAGLFTYAYIHLLSDSRIAGVVGGIVFSLSGFMIAHLGHASIIHSAIWLPLIVWALEKLRHAHDFRVLVIGGIGVGCCALAGHPQIYFYILSCSAAYALTLGWRASIGPLKYYKLCGLMFTIGLSMAAIQLVPALELAKLSLRHKMDFAEFTSFSLPPSQIPELLFPYLFGGSFSKFYGVSYFGKWNFPELSAYVGLGTLALAFIGCLSLRKNATIWFWVIAGFSSLIFAFGDATPFAKILFHVPLMNKFRAPARLILIFTFSVSVLAGLGAGALRKKLVSKRQIVAAILLVFTTLIITEILVLFHASDLQAAAARIGIRDIGFFPWSNPAIGIPFVVILLSCTALFIWHLDPSSRYKTSFFMLVLLVDLSSYAWFEYWHYLSPSNTMLSAPPSAKFCRVSLAEDHQRILPLRGGSASREELPPNLSRLWQVPSASFYGPLILEKMSRLLSIDASGYFYGSWKDENNQALDLMAVRYLLGPRPSVDEKIIYYKDWIAFYNRDMHLTFGNKLDRFTQKLEINVEPNFMATAVALVTQMAHSTKIGDNSKVLDIVIRDKNSQSKTVSVLAGRDTSEWAYDCDDVLPKMKHRRAPVFDSYDFQRQCADCKPCKGHRYVSIIEFDRSSIVTQIEIHWAGESGTITLDKLSLLNLSNHHSMPLFANTNSPSIPSRWRYINSFGDIQIYENRHVMPRAWLVPKVEPADPDETIKAIKTTKFSDGRRYSILDTALVEQPISMEIPDFDCGSTIEVLRVSDHAVELKTASASPSFLVLSDNFYPGWKASIDGVRQYIFRTNYTLRGLPVPAGEHRIKYQYRPSTFYVGVCISSITLICLALLFLYSTTFSGGSRHTLENKGDGDVLDG